jgi:hypothetical protein
LSAVWRSSFFSIFVCKQKRELFVERNMALIDQRVVFAFELVCRVNMKSLGTCRSLETCSKKYTLYIKPLSNLLSKVETADNLNINIKIVENLDPMHCT